MNEYTGADFTEKLHEEQWLTQLQETAREGSDRAVGSHSDSSSAGPAPAPATGEEALKAAAKDSLASGAQGTIVAGLSQQEGSEGASSGKAVQEETATAAAAAAAKKAGGNDRRLQHRRPQQLSGRIARRLSSSWGSICS